ncbi:oligosaccharide flippase family protein [Thermomonas sp.]|jgi:O-antigen/teichoic acid export membrane protein|uniref:lipopolysaccharide biosynthesis protein n=1 Tax=Thermomonas sp. TaxID=1971895 RepID=UPI00257B52EE|nr:oligosaccharide flippase family protein [Thermomonas sp.]
MRWADRRVPVWRPGRLARHGGALLGWMLLRAAFQAATVILLARTLTTQTYGAFVAVVAVAGFATPLAGMGLANMVLRNVARDPQAAPWYLERARSTWAWTLLPLAGITIGIALLLIPKGLPVVAMGAAVIGELLATSLTELAGRYRQAQHRHHAYGAINAGLPLSRLLALGLLVLLAGKVDIASVLWAYAAASLAYLGLLWPVVRPAKPTPTTLPAEAMSVTSGLPFSASALAMRLQGEFNKPVLAHAGFGLAGTYNIAQRAVDMASLPLLALQEALWPKLYAQANPLPQLRRTGAALLLLAAAVGALIWVAAPLLPVVVGKAHEGSIRVLRMLAWLPLLQAGRSLLNFHAIHHGRMHHISWACMVGGGTSVLAVALLVPGHGMAGAVIASYIAEITMSLVLVGAALRASR